MYRFNCHAISNDRVQCRCKFYRLYVWLLALIINGTLQLAVYSMFKYPYRYSVIESHIVIRILMCIRVSLYERDINLDESVLYM